MKSSVKANIGSGSEQAEVKISNEEVLPGTFSIKVSNYHLEDREIEFFGVSEEGAIPEGKGVSPCRRKHTNTGEIIFWFDIAELIKHEQFTNDTVECVITANNIEVGRKKLNHHSAIYFS